MSAIAKFLTGGYLAGYRTYLLGAALAIQGLGYFLAGDISFVQLAKELPDILGGMGLMSLRAGVQKAVPMLEALAAMTKKEE